MDNLSKNLQYTFAKVSKLSKFKVLATLASVVFVIYVAIKKIFLIKKHQLKTSQTSLNEPLTPRSSNYRGDGLHWLDKYGLSVVSLSGKYAFPNEDKYKNVISYIADEKKFLEDDQHQTPDVHALRSRTIPSILDSSSFKVGEERFQALASDKSKGKQILMSEMTSYFDAQKYIDSQYLKNIDIVPKTLYTSIYEKDNNRGIDKMILVRRSPDMKTDRAAREDGLLKDSGKCRTASKSLARLAEKFIFTIPEYNSLYSSGEPGTRYAGISKQYKVLRDDFDKSNSIDISGYNFTAEKLLGKDCFTISKNQEGSAEVDILLASKPETCLLASAFKKDPTQALLINYTIVLTVFPYNAEDIINIIELESICSLTEDDKKFLLAVANSAKKLNEK